MRYFFNCYSFIFLFILIFCLVFHSFSRAGEVFVFMKLLKSSFKIPQGERRIARTHTHTHTHTPTHMTPLDSENSTPLTYEELFLTWRCHDNRASSCLATGCNGKKGVGGCVCRVER